MLCHCLAPLDQKGICELVYSAQMKSVCVFFCLKMNGTFTVCVCEGSLQECAHACAFVQRTPKCWCQTKATPLLPTSRSALPPRLCPYRTDSPPEWSEPSRAAQAKARKVSVSLSAACDRLTDVLYRDGPTKNNTSSCGPPAGHSQHTAHRQGGRHGSMHDNKQMQMHTRTRTHPDQQISAAHIDMLWQMN